MSLIEILHSPSADITQTVASKGLRVRPVTVVVVDSVRVRQDSSVEPGLSDDTNTATHCMVASSVNNRVPFWVVESTAGSVR